jgi:hypothetical protein
MPFPFSLQMCKSLLPSAKLSVGTSPLSALTLRLQNLILHPEGTPGIAKKLKSVTKEQAVRELTDENVKILG